MMNSETKRLQIRVSAEVAQRVDDLSVLLGVPQSAVGSMLIVAGLARVGEALDDPSNLGTVLHALQEGKAGN